MQNEKQRTCGECSECCKTHQVIELKKRAGKWCRFRVKGLGCRIYQKHPKGCVQFECQWLKGHGEESDRPDRTGIVVDCLVLELIGETIVLYEGMNGAFDGEYGKALVAHYIHLNFPVFKKFLSGKEVFLIPRTLQISLKKLQMLIEEKRQIFIAEAH